MSVESPASAPRESHRESHAPADRPPVSGEPTERWQDIEAIAASLPDLPELEAIRRRSQRWEQATRFGTPRQAEQDRADLLRLVDGLRLVARTAPEAVRRETRGRATPRADAPPPLDVAGHSDS